VVSKPHFIGLRRIFGPDLMLARRGRGFGTTSNHYERFELYTLSIWIIIPYIGNFLGKLSNF
jgi:hypothetical protein